MPTSLGMQRAWPDRFLHYVWHQSDDARAQVSRFSKEGVNLPWSDTEKLSFWQHSPVYLGAYN